MGTSNAASAKSRRRRKDEDAELVEAGSKPASSEKRRNNPAADALECVRARGIELWHDAQETAYVTLSIDGRQEHHAVHSAQFRAYVAKCYYDAHKWALGDHALKSVLQVLSAEARYEGTAHTTFVRVAPHDGNIYIDLGDEHRRAVEVSKSGYRVVDSVPVKFLRSSTTAALPMPEDGSLQELVPFLNLSDADQRMFIAGLLAAYHPTGPYPIMIIQGPQGSAKSTLARMYGALTDPSHSQLQSFPNSTRDLMVAAKHQHLLSYDNVSKISGRMADDLCRLATGTSFVSRRLYTSDDQHSLYAKRPLVLTGIGELAQADDLRERAYIVEPLSIHARERRTESSIDSAFTEAKGRIFGGILSALVAALANVDRVQLEELPRMADAALWVTAAEAALGWPAGTHSADLEANTASGVAVSLEYNPVGSAVTDLMRGLKEWTGTATDLLETLTPNVPSAILRSGDWPRSAPGIANAIERLVPALRAVGIDVEKRRATSSDRTRLIVLRRNPNVWSTLRRSVRPPGNVVHQHREEDDEDSDWMGDDWDDVSSVTQRAKASLRKSARMIEAWFGRSRR